MLINGPEDNSFCQTLMNLQTAHLLFVCKTEGTDSAIPRLMHSHKEHIELMYIAKGSGDYTINGQVYVGQQGDALIFNAGTTHDERPHLRDDSLIYSCAIERIRFDNLPENHLIGNEKPALVFTGEQGNNIKMMFDILIKQYMNKEIYYKAISHNIMMSLILLYKKVFDAHQSENNRTEANIGQYIKSFIDQHYTENITIESIANELSMSRFYVSHTFKKYSGYSPKQYLIRRRIGEAQSLLLRTNNNVKNIASLTGYNNTHNFNKMFKDIVGISPNQYKKIWGSEAHQEKTPLPDK